MPWPRSRARRRARSEGVRTAAGRWCSGRWCAAGQGRGTAAGTGGGGDGRVWGSEVGSCSGAEGPARNELPRERGRKAGRSLRSGFWASSGVAGGSRTGFRSLGSSAGRCGRGAVGGAFAEALPG